MSNELCSPFNCNICLLLRSYQLENQNHLAPYKKFQHLLTCSGCCLIKYCNIDHQKHDWPIHREFCRAVQKIKENFNILHPFYIGELPQNRGDIEKATIQLKYLLRHALGRHLKFHEEELTSFPPLCGQCFNFIKLKVVCLKCYSQPYCSEQHRELHKDKHAQVCKLLQLYYCPFKVQVIDKEFCVKFGNKLEDMYKMDLVECIQKAFSIKLPSNPCQTRKNYMLFSWAADFSCILTICYALSLSNIQEWNSEKCEIFILGSTIEPILWFREVHCKFFFLQHPHIKELALVFIGPEVNEAKYQQLEFSFLGSVRRITFKIYKELFQDYCKHHKVEPSLITIFNCGFSEFSQCYNVSPTSTSSNTLEPLEATGAISKNEDTWFLGLKEILQTFDTPIVFTSFTEQESQFDFAALKNAAIKQDFKVHIDRIFKATKNPFHDLRPLRQWYTHDKEEFYYRNGYIQGIRTKLEL